ncbi:hypothetical protein [Aquimarina sp. 2201CG5-10]|uniref:hypothetical protein n=1 Tax=Aquimarina callyspongiae TaxID=3098150 RepID=UPI002AB35489|nr:hypothetical protein [Aquimarina sp. 2201CG5-10]MDY8138118.1 hypothetical protein [Aquimarina sp. 2201CG5-10]
MRISQFSANIIFVFILCSFNLLLAQPEYSSKQLIEGIAIFHDKTDPLLFYYQPGDLILNHTDNGDPDFRFLDMRYTGSKCYNDIGEKGFMSIVQFGVTMKKIEANVLKNIKIQLKKRGAIKLKPLPISHINTRLILPVEGNDEKKYETIDNDGALEANDKSGYTSSKSFWTKRTYTVKLTKYESQILSKQLKDDLLALNLSYSYYSDVWINDEQINGSKELLEQFKKDSIVDDQNNLQNRVIKSNTLTIGIDTKKYPKAIKQIDLNEEIPPTYAAIEVKCHDFLEELRPDLYMKIIEVEAITVNNNKTTQIETKFLRKHKDLYTQHINFPYAIQMNAPMRYRVTEIDINGERTISKWKDKPECSSIIDVTSTDKEQKITNEIVDVEIDNQIFDNESFTKLEFYLFYSINNKIQSQELIFSDSDDIPLQSIRYKKDKSTPIYYLIKKHTIDGETIIENETELTDNYLYISN